MLLKWGVLLAFGRAHVKARSCSSSSCRADLKLGASYLFNHLRCFGLMMRIGFDTSLSKTEAIYFSSPCVDYSNANTPRFEIRNSDGSTAGFVDFTKEFKYLGSIIDSSLTSDADVDQ